MAEISLAPQYIFSIGSFNVSNALLGTLLITLLLILLGLHTKKTFGIIPTRLQVAFELIYNYLFEQVEQAFGSKEKAKKFFPLMGALFIFIMIANQFSLIPFVTNIVSEGVPVFRTATSDLSLVLALALIVLVGAHALALYIAPVSHIGSFFKFKAFTQVKSFGDFFNACIEFFLGLLDIVGEIAKLVSISFRLFGNVFAGEIMVAIIAGLSVFTTFIVPIPFLALSIFSGLVQAFVFTMLATNFMAGTIRAAEDARERKRAKEQEKLEVVSQAVSV